MENLYGYKNHEMPKRSSQVQGCCQILLGFLLLFVVVFIWEPCENFLLFLGITNKTCWNYQQPHSSSKKKIYNYPEVLLVLILATNDIFSDYAHQCLTQLFHLDTKQFNRNNQPITSKSTCENQLPNSEDSVIWLF